MSDRAPDIHFVPEYARTFEAHEGGTVEVFHADCRHGRVSHLFIKRPVEGFPDCSDIFTPYGYGGPIILECEPGCEEELVREYSTAFDSFCRENKIVCAFTRFHPIFHNAETFRSCYDEVVAVRKIVIIDLTADVFNQEFSIRARKAYRSTTADSGIEIVYDDRFEYLDDFLEIYYDAMDRKNALDYYYFSRGYFSKLITDNPGHVMLLHARVDGEIIASTLNLSENGIIYGQFGATKAGCYHYDGYTAIIAHCACRYADNPRYTHFVLGGGLTNAPDDSLLSYKKRFSKSLHDFHTGKRIYDHSTYSEICAAAGVSDDGISGFFPQYRQR